MNTKMKVLSLALVGAFGYVGAASAACPTSATPPWTSALQVKGVAAIASPGYAGTECRLDTSFNADAGSSSIAAVTYSGTGAEAAFRAQFIVDTSALTAPVAADTVSIYSGSSTAGGSAVRLRIFGSGGSFALGYAVSYDDAGVRRSRTGSVPLPAGGPKHVEIQLKTAAAGASDGEFRIWVENNVEASPNKVESGLANSAMAGVEKVQLGLFAGSPAFLLHYNTKKVGFDQYDSRRTTFIGF